ncbi:MAG: TonB-dependent receptor [Bacteroidetes bacterium]|nr:TonB-dependent receptor [Bacteroidota bacterium]
MKKLLFLVFIPFFSFSQQSKTIKGSLLDENDQPLPFANVLLLKSKDSTLFKALTSDVGGNFEFKDAKDGSFKLRISMVGYQDFYSPAFVISDESPVFSISSIKMALNTTVLKELKVVAKKPFIEQQIDRTVVNVENSIVASGNTALEVLEKAPGVIVDRQNNDLKLKNKNGVLVMIDGRRNYLSNEALVQMLGNMTSDQIESIEIITNPSSKYDASGNSGIINIKLKKNKAFGTNGTVSVTAGDAFIPNSTSDLYRGSGSVSLNHRNKKWNVYGNGTLNRNAFYSDNNLSRVVDFEGLNSRFTQQSQRNGSGIYSAIKLGADYFANESTTLGWMFDANNWNGGMNSTGLTRIAETKNNENINSSLVPISEMDNDNWNYTGNFNLKKALTKKGKEYTIDADYSGFRNYSFQSFDTRYYDANQNETSALIQRNSTPSDIDIFAAKFDFTLPMEDKSKVEFGAKSSFVKTDNDFRFDQFQENVWSPDLGKTNHFVYKEFVNAAYINWGKQWKKVGIQSGLRAEYTNSEGNSKTLNKVVPRSYLSIFPTFFLNQQLTKNHSMRYSYSRRIGRPNYQQLNPFLFFLDPYTFQRGNEFLKPQFTDNLELAYTYKGSVSLSLGYAHIKDNMFDVLEQDDKSKVTYQTSTNLENVENYSANLSFPIPVTKWWNMQNNFNLYYARFRDSDVSGGKLDVGQLAYNFYTSSTFSLKKGWSAEANMWYNSPQVMGIIRTDKAQYAVNGGVQKTIFEGKGKLKFNVNDLFLTSFFNGYVKYQNVDLKVSNRWTSRRVSLTFSYNFGNQNVKASRRRGTATDDLKQRAGSQNQ